MLLSFIGDDTHEILTFDNGAELTVSFWTGSAAESMVVRGPGNVVVVWE